MTDALEHARAETFRFGGYVENQWASERNPIRRGIFVRTVIRRGRMNAGKWAQMTDGKGKFWECSFDRLVKLSDDVPALTAARAQADAELAVMHGALEPFARKFDAHVQNPKMAEDRRNWNERMPGEWPMKLEITMEDGRRARDAYFSSSPRAEAVTKVIATGQRLDRCLTEFDGDPTCCDEYFSAFFDALDRLDALRGQG